MKSVIFVKFKLWLRQISRRQHLMLCLLVLFTLALHFGIIMHPNELLFDERHYIADARSIIAKEGTLHPEQPPLGKLFIVEGIHLFGDNPLGWRFFSVLFGTICIVPFYFICGGLKMSNQASLLATFLFGLENLSFVQASVAMLDVYSVTFMLGAFLLYLRGNYLSSGICVGLSALAKLTGALALAVIFLHWLLTGRRRWQGFVVPVFSAAISFLLFMPPLDYAVSLQLLNPIGRIEYMLDFARSVTFNGGYYEAASRPWDWLVNRVVIFYWYDPQYIAMVSPTICILIIPVVLYMLFKATRRNGAVLFGLLWFASIYLPWILVSLITDRVTYLYYFYPTVGAICIGLGVGLSQLLDLWKSKRPSKVGGVAALAVSGYLVFHSAIFVILSPLAVPLVRWLPTLEPVAGISVGCQGTTEFIAQLHIGRADGLTDQGRYEQAVEEYGSAITHDPSSVRAYASRGWAYSSMGRYDAAIADCDGAIALGPNVDALYDIRAAVYLKMGKWDMAIADCDRAITLDPDTVGAYLTRGAAYLELRQYPRARADCSKAILLDPHQATAYNTRGIAYGSEGEYARAVADFSKAIAVNPTGPEAYYNRGITYKIQGDKAKAMADLDRFISLTNDPERIQAARHEMEQLTK